jgi:hypothetical protein
MLRVRFARLSGGTLGVEIMHENRVDLATRRRRRTFAILRIAEVSLAVLGGILALLALTPPSSPGHTPRELYFLAWSTPRVFMAAAGALLAAAVLLQILSRPLKRRWAEQLRGWIN